jgi:hypothetical protein
MKTLDADIHFPAIGFTTDGLPWGFKDLDKLTSSGPRSLRQNLQVGMEIVDADGRRWVVQSVWRTGRALPLLSWLIWAVLEAGSRSRVEYELSPMDPISLRDVKARVRAWIEADPWPPCHEDDDTDEKELARIDAAGSIAEVYEKLGLDGFGAY